MCEARGEFVVLSFEQSDTSRTFVRGEFVSSKPKAHRVKEEMGSFVVLKVRFINIWRYMNPYGGW